MDSNVRAIFELKTKKRVASNYYCSIGSNFLVQSHLHVGRRWRGFKSDNNVCRQLALNRSIKENSLGQFNSGITQWTLISTFICLLNISSLCIQSAMHGYA